MQNDINIKIPKRITGKIKAFEKNEWHIADIEHYGKDRDCVKRKYKFIADNKFGDILGILDLIIEANVALVENLLVSSKDRRQGIGKKLILEAERFAKKHKCNKVWVETNEDWNAAKFYKKVNYKVTGTHEKHYFNKKGLIFTKYL